MTSVTPAKPEEPTIEDLIQRYRNANEEYKRAALLVRQEERELYDARDRLEKATVAQTKAAIALAESACKT